MEGKRRHAHRKARKEDPLLYALQREQEKSAAAAAEHGEEGGEAAGVTDEPAARNPDDARASLALQRRLGRKRKRQAALIPVGSTILEMLAKQANAQEDASTLATPTLPLLPAATATADASAWGMHPHLLARVEGIARFFPIQRDVIPLLLRADATGDPTVGDFCVSAPTGSGKTLVYVLPIVHALLSRRVVRRLRALVLVPTRDLAAQVVAVFQRFTAGTDIVVFSSTGQTSIAAEQDVLRWSGGADTAAATADGAAAAALGCDILVSTPGRLVEHLDSTPGFTLEHLRWWVVDEADRLLSESYQDWPRRVHEGVFGGGGGSGDSNGRIVPRTIRSSQPLRPDLLLGARARAAAPCVKGAGSEASILDEVLHPPSWLVRPTQPRLNGGFSGSIDLTPLRVPFRVIVCSATLTTNPRKLASLQLRVPLHFTARADVGGAVASDPAADPIAAYSSAPAGSGKRTYTLPASLTQAYAVCGAGDKPVLVVHLLRMLEKALGSSSGEDDSEAAPSGLLALVFAGSVETTHRLARLLQLFGGLEGRVVEFSATLSQSQRTAVLEAARAGAVSVLVSSDVAARGIDLPTLPVVIHYDAAPRVKTYVHRVGRAARAGRPGTSFTLLKPEQVAHFRGAVLGRVRTQGRAAVKETLMASTLQPYAVRFGRVLEALHGVVERERSGKLLPTKILEPLEPLNDLPRLSDSPNAAGGADATAVDASASSGGEEEEEESSELSSDSDDSDDSDSTSDAAD
jgi:ATP-dependent RNA helicase DDX51/DBP6